MLITVKLFATFRQDRFDVQNREYPLGTTVGDIVKGLNLPEDKLGILMVNSRHVDLERELHEGEAVAIFPLVGGG
jgi:sulfur-carrier protein